MNEQPGEAGCRSPSQVIMNLLTRFLQFLQEVFNLIPGELTGEVQAMAKLEGLTPNELVARIIRDTIQEHRDSESLSGRWGEADAAPAGDRHPDRPELTNTQIAARLGISEATVKTHQTHIMERLNLRSRYSLRQALEGLTSPRGRKDEGETICATTGRFWRMRQANTRPLTPKKANQRRAFPQYLMRQDCPKC